MEESNLGPDGYMRIFDNYDIRLILSTTSLEIKLYFKEQKTQYYRGLFTQENIPPDLSYLFSSLEELYKELQIVD